MIGKTVTLVNRKCGICGSIIKAGRKVSYNTDMHEWYCDMGECLIIITTQA